MKGNYELKFLIQQNVIVTTHTATEIESLQYWSKTQKLKYVPWGTECQIRTGWEEELLQNRKKNWNFYQIFGRELQKKRHLSGKSSHPPWEILEHFWIQEQKKSYTISKIFRVPPPSWCSRSATEPITIERKQVHKNSIQQYYFIQLFHTLPKFDQMILHTFTRTVLVSFLFYIHSEFLNIFENL